MLNLLTIVYNGEPYIERHLPIFEKLTVPWKWFVVEGPANNEGSTSWCNPQNSGISTDGTWEYLRSVTEKNKNVALFGKDLWRSKDAMVQTALNEMREPGVLLQIDSDEIWSAGQLEKIVELFESDPSLGAIKFRCNYFVGPNLVCVGEDCWSNKNDEYRRAWRFAPGMKAISHEPPVFDRQLGWTMQQAQSKTHGLVFEHHAYVTEAQVAYKEKFYGGLYSDASIGWRLLQAMAPVIKHPVPLKQFFPWVDDKVMVQRTTLSGGVVTAENPRQRGEHHDRPISPKAPAAQNIFYHTGDLGDIIASLPAIRALGGGHLVIGHGTDGQRGNMEGERFGAIKPLLDWQPYLSRTTWSNDKTGVTHDFSGFRQSKAAATLAGLNLAEWQAQHIGVEDVSLMPWLTVEPDRVFEGFVIFSRSNRYHNPLFPWSELLKRFREVVIFVGLPDEHLAFEQEFGHIYYMPVADLRHLAALIAACKLFIGNQSAPYWIAAGLGVPLVQETCVNEQNSIVPRYNAIYTRTDYETSRLLDEIDDIMEKVVV